MALALGARFPTSGGEPGLDTPLEGPGEGLREEGRGKPPAWPRGLLGADRVRLPRPSPPLLTLLLRWAAALFSSYAWRLREHVHGTR